MKLSVRPLSTALLLAFALTACSSKEDDEPVLPEISNKMEPVEVWSSSVGNGIQHFDSRLKPVIFDNKVYAASRDGEIAAFELETGKEVWSIDLRDGDDAPLFGGISHWWNERSAKIGGGVSAGFDKIFVGTEDGEVIAFNPQTGEKAVSQVKTGNVVLNRDDYSNFPQKVFLFQSNDLYSGYEYDNVVCFSRNEVLKFLNSSQGWMPRIIQRKMELIH